MGMTTDGLSYASDDAYWFLFLEQSAKILFPTSLRSRSVQRRHSSWTVSFVALNFLRRPGPVPIVERLPLLTMPLLVPPRMILPSRRCQDHPFLS